MDFLHFIIMAILQLSSKLHSKVYWPLLIPVLSPISFHGKFKYKNYIPPELTIKSLSTAELHKVSAFIWHFANVIQCFSVAAHLGNYSRYICYA